MDDWFYRVSHDFIGRLDGPLHFRFILQPIMAIAFAIRDGIHDARFNRPAYLWSVLTDPENRGELLHDGWKSIARVFLLGLGMDVVYQLIVFHWIYIGEMLLTATILALLPYALLRGPVNRIARHWLRGGSMSSPVH